MKCQTVHNKTLKHPLYNKTYWTEKDFLFLYCMGFRHIKDEILGMCTRILPRYTKLLVVHLLENQYLVSCFRMIIRRSLLSFMLRSKGLFMMDVWCRNNQESMTRQIAKYSQWRQINSAQPFIEYCPRMLSHFLKI